MFIDNTQAASNEELARYILVSAPKKFDLMGLSMGGYAAFEIIKQTPHEVRKLILLDTTARPDSEEKRAKRLDRIEKIRNGKLEQVTQDLWKSMVAENRVEDIELFNLYNDMVRSIGTEGFDRQIQQVLSRGKFLSLLPKIKNDTLVIVGEDDQRSPIHIAQ